MGAVDYLTTSYYEHWLCAVETLLEEGGVVERAQIDRRVAAGRTTVDRRTDPALVERVQGFLVRGGGRSWEGPGHRFAVGQRVRARRDITTHGGHTRCPRYVRGLSGVVTHQRPLEPLPEGLPERRLEPVPCYTVAFSSADLWGPTAEVFTLAIDLVEPYLEAVP
jgi:nitrile hydratase